MENIYLQIDTSSKQAKALIEYLKSLNFVHIVDSELSLEQEKELGKRLAYSMAHPEEGVTWDEMEKEWKNEEKV
jgi:hypothetical protein